MIGGAQPFPPKSTPCCRLQVDGESHVVHVEEEAAGTRLTLGPSTCLLAKEADPSRLIATSPGDCPACMATE